MRIGLFTDLYPPYVGGQQTRFRELATRLAARGHEVHVYCVGHAEDQLAEEVLDGVTIHRFPRTSGYERPLITYTQRAVLPTLRYALWVRRVARDEGFDFVYYNQWPLAHVLVAPRSVRSRAAIDWCELRSGFPNAQAQRFLPRRVSRNFCVNRALAKRLTELAGAPVDYLPSGVATEHYHSNEQSQRAGLLFMGRLVYNKNIPLLVQSFGRYREMGHAGELTIVGDGPLRAELEGELARLPAEARNAVRVIPYVSEEEKIELLASSRVLLLPSRREGFPNVVAEAMASGLPVVTVSILDNGTKDVVGEYGIGVVTDPVPDAVAKGIVRAEANWRHYSERGLAAADSIHWERIVDQLLLVGEDALVR